MLIINTNKLMKQVNTLEMKSNYVNSEYYHSKFIKASKILELYLSYDKHYMYIDDFTQYKQALANNRYIEEKIQELKRGA